MRIFCAVRHSIDPNYYYGALWSGNFYSALRGLGHEILESQTDLCPTSTFMHIGKDFTREELELRAQTTEKILEEVRIGHQHAPIDVFLSYFYNSHCEPAFFDELRRLGILSVNFYCNSIYQFELVESIAAKVDFAWHAEKNAREKYLQAGANPVWVQMGANPEVYHPINGVSRQPKACFVGQRYADRDRWIAALLRSGVPVEVYGPGWGAGGTTSPSNGRSGGASAHLGRSRTTPGSWQSYFDTLVGNIKDQGIASGTLRTLKQAAYRNHTRKLLRSLSEVARAPVPFKDVTAVFAQYEICLNFSNVWSDGRPGSRLIPHVRLRDFEGPMSRTCYLTGDSDELTEFYDVGQEVDTYRTPEELADKIRFYLRNPNAAENLREAGYRRALNEHTWVNRFQELFRKIGMVHGA